MTVHLIEPGLVSRTGHFFDYALGIARLLQSRGVAVVVHAHEAASPDVGAMFAAAGLACETSVPAELHRVSQASNGQADGGWLRRPLLWLSALAAAAGPDDRWLFPTLRPPAMFALGALPARPFVAAGVQTPPEIEGRDGATLWRSGAAALVRSGAHCRLLAIDPLVAEMTALHSDGLPVAAGPIAHGRWTRRTASDALRVVGFFGHQRGERGLSLLPPLVQGLRRRGLQVLVHDSRARLSVPAGTPGIEIVHGFVDDLDALVARCDLALCPMDRQRYRYRISGVATTALAAGVPVALPAATLTERRWRGSGALRVWHDEGPDAQLAAVDAARADYAACAQAAQEVAADWSQRHGLVRFVDAALAPH